MFLNIRSEPTTLETEMSVAARTLHQVYLGPGIQHVALGTSDHQVLSHIYRNVMHKLICFSFEFLGELLLTHSKDFHSVIDYRRRYCGLGPQVTLGGNVEMIVA